MRSARGNGCKVHQECAGKAVGASSRARSVSANGFGKVMGAAQVSKNLLHKTKLEKFIEFLDAQKIEHRKGRGEWQALQVRANGNEWYAVFERLKMPEHYSTDKRLDSLIARFCREFRA
jgi:hypothetical protein